MDGASGQSRPNENSRSSVIRNGSEPKVSEPKGSTKTPLTTKETTLKASDSGNIAVVEKTISNKTLPGGKNSFGDSDHIALMRQKITLESSSTNGLKNSNLKHPIGIMYGSSESLAALKQFKQSFITFKMQNVDIHTSLPSVNNSKIPTKNLPGGNNKTIHSAHSRSVTNGNGNVSSIVSKPSVTTTQRMANKNGSSSSSVSKPVSATTGSGNTTAGVKQPSARSLAGENNSKSNHSINIAALKQPTVVIKNPPGGNKSKSSSSGNIAVVKQPITIEILPGYSSNGNGNGSSSVSEPTKTSKTQLLSNKTPPKSSDSGNTTAVKQPIAIKTLPGVNNSNSGGSDNIAINKIKSKLLPPNESIERLNMIQNRLKVASKSTPNKRKASPESPSILKVKTCKADPPKAGAANESKKKPRKRKANTSETESSSSIGKRKAEQEKSAVVKTPASKSKSSTSTVGTSHK
jgi:hypothetical protein